MRKNPNGSITLCPMCIPLSCCPTVSKTPKGSINISDDYGSSIIIEKSEIKNLLKSVNEFLSMQSSTMDSKR